MERCRLMPSQLPKPSEGYRVGIDDSLNAALWNFVFGDVNRRIQMLEQLKVSFEVIENAGINVALARIDAVIVPGIDALNAHLDQAGQKTAEIEALLTQLQASGLEAKNVDLSAIEGLIATDVQAALAEVIVAIGAVTTSLADTLTTAMSEEVTARNVAIAAETSARETAIAEARPSYANVQKFM